MNSKHIRVLVGLFAGLALLASGCGSSNSSSSNGGSSNTQTGQVAMLVSDDPLNDWSEIGIKVLSISLTPQGGGAPVVVFSPPTPPTINLVELDQLADILETVSVPAGTYTGGTVTVSANPGDVTLIASSNPDPGFAGTPGEVVPSNQIQIIGATGTAGSLTVPLNVTFESPVTVTAGQNSGIDFEFDLSHPAFIVAHNPLGGGATIWAVNFKPAFRHHPIFDITRLVLRHLYASFVSVSSDNTSITVTRVFPQEPPVNPEQPISTSKNLTILADAANGTLFYDMDAHTHSTIMNFGSVATSLNGKFLRIAARYQSDGSLVAVRIWTSSSFNTVWINPEGHVRHVLTASNQLVVDNEDGQPVTVDVDSNTQFFFRAPANPLSDAKPFCIGTGCLSDLVRGFKVHISADPLQNPLLAQTVDIEIARFDGMVSAPTNTTFVYTRDFTDASDDYVRTMFYISSATHNGHDPLSGKQITGFKWWNFAFPTLQDNDTISGDSPIPDFVTATGYSVNFGGTVGALHVFGGSYAIWNDPANPNGWAVPWTVLVPAPVPLAKVASGWVTLNGTGDFTITVPSGSNAVTVDASLTRGSAPLVYQVDRNNGIITISPVDVTTPAGQSTLQTNLVSGTPVKVFGVPQLGGSVKAYVFFYFTGTMPAS